MTQPPLDPERPQRRAADPTASVWVAASAGTGKTKVLTDRVISLLLAGTAPHRILCLTFTKAAAAEMANRIARRLAGWATATDADLAADLARLRGAAPDDAVATRARRLFAQVLDAPGGMKIQTIHAFCQSLLRRFPLEAGLAPHFAVMDERQAGELMADAQEAVLTRARDGADEALGAALAEVTGYLHETAFPDLLAALAAERGRLRRMRDLHGGLDAVVAALRARLDLGVGDTPEAVRRAACDDAAFDASGCRRIMQRLLGGAKTDVERGGAMAAWLALAPDDRAADFASWRTAFLTKEGEIRKTLCTKAVRAAEPEADDLLRREAERMVRVDNRFRAAVVASASAALLRLGGALLDGYESAKSDRALMDYDDLVLTAVRLLEDPGVAAWVLFKLDGGIDHVLIDEAQDTNPDQWAVVRALTTEFFAGQGARDTVRTVFAVGDVKQSIYSFQRADPREFERMRALFAAHVPAAGATWDEVPLQISFRSTRAVLDVVDAVFSRQPGRDGVVPGDIDLRHIPWRDRDGGLVELWPPVEPLPTDEAEPWKPPVERVRADSPRARLARLMARRIAAMVGVERLESKGRAVRAGDVLVLVRRRNAFVDDLIRFLKQLDVPVAGADRMVLTEQMAVMDLMALGNAVLLPDDDLTLATVLKGPLVGLGEDALFTLANPRKPASLWSALRDRAAAGEPPFAAAHAGLADVLAMADHVPPHEFYAHVLYAQGGLTRLLERLGPEALDPVDEFMSLTLAYERGHALSLQGFLHWLESGDVQIKRDLEQDGQDAVRIMTVHGAKGLQAPVVFLPDTLQAPAKLPALLWPESEDGPPLMLWLPRAELADDLCDRLRAAAKRARDQEYRRLLYVALTRAEDRLYVCGWRTKNAPPEECWYNLIQAAMHQATGAGLVDDAVLAADGDMADPRVLRLTCPQTAPVTGKAAAAAAPVVPLPDWTRAPPPPEPSPPRPLMPSRPDGDEPPARSPVGADDGARYRRGRLVHRLLQSLPDLDAAARGAAAVRFLARPAWGLSATQQTEIALEVAAVLADSRFGAVFGPGSRAEVPVVGLVGDRVVSGQVDRLVVTAGEVLVVDFKTNRPPPPTADAVSVVYLRQMAAYRAALACIYPGRAVRCALLWTDGPRLMPLDGARLDDVLAGVR